MYNFEMELEVNKIEEKLVREMGEVLHQLKTLMEKKNYNDEEINKIFKDHLDYGINDGIPRFCYWAYLRKIY